MLLIVVLSLACLATTLAGLSNFVYHRNGSPPTMRQLENHSCKADCVLVYPLISSCANSSELWCGCLEVLNSGDCSECLERTNSMLSGYHDAELLSTAIGFCKCRNVMTCEQYVAAVKQCTNPACICTACLKYLPGTCATCWEVNGGNTRSIDSMMRQSESMASSASPRTITLGLLYLLHFFRGSCSKWRGWHCVVEIAEQVYRRLTDSPILPYSTLYYILMQHIMVGAYMDIT